MKLFVKIRDGGKVKECRVIGKETVMFMNDKRGYTKDCDLCDEDGNLLVPEQSNPIPLTDNTTCPICNTELNPLSSSEVSVEWMMDGKWHRCHIGCIEVLVLNRNKVIPMEDAMAFTEWVYEHAGRHKIDKIWITRSLVNGDVEGEDFDTTVDMYNYWKTNIKEDQS